MNVLKTHTERHNFVIGDKEEKKTKQNKKKHLKYLAFLLRQLFNSWLPSAP